MSEAIDPVKIDVAGSSPASPASFDPKAVIEAVIDYNWSIVKQKMLIDGLNYEDAVSERLAEIMAEGSEDA
jgi:hypothetical protein